MAKIKNKVKKVFRLPSNAVVMSMMAVILVCAAPALVSVIDDTYVSEYDSVVTMDVTDAFFASSTLGVGPIDSSFLMTDTGSLIVVIDDVTDLADAESVNILLSKDYFLDGYYNLNLDLNGATVGLIRFQGLGSGVVNIGNFVESDDGISFEIPSVEKVKIQNGVYSGFRINIQAPELNQSYEITVTGSQGITIPYGEIIIGATGALLLICALMATPWFGTSGITIRRRR